MQRSGASAELATRILSEISDRHLRQIDFRERHRRALAGRFGCVVGIVNKDRHPLIAGSVRIDRTATLPGRLDLNAFRARFDRVVRVGALDDEIGMAVEVIVLGQSARMLRQARCEQIGKEAGHDRRAEEVVEAFQSLFEEARIDVVEKIVNILHRDLKVFQTELKRKRRGGVEIIALRAVTLRGHATRQRRERPSARLKSGEGPAL